MYSICVIDLSDSIPILEVVNDCCLLFSNEGGWEENNMRL